MVIMAVVMVILMVTMAISMAIIMIVMVIIMIVIMVIKESAASPGPWEQEPGGTSAGTAPGHGGLSSDCCLPAAMSTRGHGNE